MNNIVDHHGRSQTACTKAGYTLNGKQAVFGSMLTGFHPDCFIHSIGNVIRAADVAGSTITTFHNIFSFCFEREVAVECGNTINLRRADADLLGSVLESLFREISVFLLNILHNADNLSGIVVMIFQNGIYEFKIYFHETPPLLFLPCFLLLETML